MTIKASCTLNCSSNECKVKLAKRKAQEIRFLKDKLSEAIFASKSAEKGKEKAIESKIGCLWRDTRYGQIKVIGDLSTPFLSPLKKDTKRPNLNQRELIGN